MGGGGGETVNNIRLNFIVEGQTEETFINRQLVPYLAERSIWASVRCVQTSRKRNTKYRGGLTSYAQARDDISVHEFEALVLADPTALSDEYPESAAGVDQHRSDWLIEATGQMSPFRCLGGEA